ncbi:hypothetical protein FI667_g16202, partial [Globisporangium splendens]
MGDVSARKSSVSNLSDGGKASLGDFLDGWSSRVVVPSSFGKNQQQPSCVGSELLHDHNIHHGQMYGYHASEHERFGGSDWACPALIEDECMVSSFQDTPCQVEDPLANFPSDNMCEANCALPYFGTCWMTEHNSNGSNVVMPVDSNPDGHFGFNYAEHGKHVPPPSMGLSSPAQVGHFMPFVHQGEPEVMFAGMELNNNEFHNLHLSHHHPPDATGPHHLEHHDHQHVFFPHGIDGNTTESSIDQLMHRQNHPQLAAHFEGTTNGLGLQQPELEFHGRTQRKGAWREELHPGVKDHKHSLHLEITPKQLPQDTPRVLRGRSSADHKVSPGASASEHTMNTTDKAVLPPPSANFYAEVRLVTVLNDCYWKNGRKNLQCFPVCPEHNDFYSMKMNNRKHSSVGVCRGPVYCHVFAKAAEQAAPSPSSSSRRAAVAKALMHQSSTDAYGSASLPSVPSGQHMKYEYGVGASGTGGSSQELFVLGRFERVPQRDNTDLIEELAPPPVFTSSAAFEEFRYGCFQAVEMQERRTTFASMNCENFHHENNISSGVPSNPDARASETTASTSSSVPPLQCTAMGDDESMVRSTWFFLPDVWKVQPMLKKKRKATRSAPAQTFPFCFRVFVYTCLSEFDDSGNNTGATTGRYTCVSSTVSSFFELYSTRTVDRVKRKYWSSTPSPRASAVAKKAAPFAGSHGTTATNSKRQRLAAYK